MRDRKALVEAGNHPSPTQLNSTPLTLASTQIQDKDNKLVHYIHRRRQASETVLCIRTVMWSPRGIPHVARETTDP